MLAFSDFGASFLTSAFFSFDSAALASVLATVFDEVSLAVS
jgi:hypothetical protein